MVRPLRAQKDLVEYHGRLYDDPHEVRNKEFLEFCPGRDKERLEEFYRMSALTAFDLALWHDTSPVLSALFPLYTKIAAGRVLDFGAGIGTLDIYLADAGHDVDYLEINEFCRGFAAWRFRKYGVEERIKQVEEPSGDYGTIFLLDVIGHLKNPGGVLKTLSMHMVTGSTLVYTDDAVESDTHPMHFSLDFDLNFFLAAIGLHRVYDEHVKVWRK